MIARLAPIAFLLLPLLTGCDSEPAPDSGSDLVSERPQRPRAPIPSESDAANSLSNLPSSIEFAPGTLSLVADDKGDSAGSIDLYLVNATEEMIELKSQDRDVYLKLEVLQEGQWIRAQSHYFSECGHSYFPGPTIMPGHFHKFSGHQPGEGEPATIRYSLYLQAFQLSSTGQAGRFDPEELARAARSGDLEFVERVARGEVVLTNSRNHWKDLQEVAIRELSSDRFDSALSVPALQKISVLLFEWREEVTKALARIERRDSSPP